MQEQASRRAYQTVDGLRAVGAYLVVMRHVPDFFGPIDVPESFLAVDLFYLFSGFVVAHAYGSRLQKGGFLWSFVKTRLVRLYPFYLIGLGLGIAVAVISVILDPKGWWTPLRLVEGVFAGVLMIPLFPGLGANGSSLDGPVWTLLPELIANVVYAAFIRLMTPWVLGLILLLNGGAVAFAEYRFGTLDVGFGPTDQWAAVARVGFSFFSGVVLFRLLGERKRTSEIISWAALVILAAILAFHPSDALTPFYEMGAVMVGFPALLAIAVWFEPTERTGRTFTFLGGMSYGVYILHVPLGNLVRTALRGRVQVPRGEWGLLTGLIFLVLVTAVAAGIDRWVEAPVRGWLRRWFLAGLPAQGAKDRAQQGHGEDLQGSSITVRPPKG